MKPQGPRQQHRSVDRQSKEKKKEKDFEVFLQGANQERVQHKRIKESDKKLPPKEIKKWKPDPNQKISIEENIVGVEEDNGSDIIQEIASLDDDNYQLLRKSLCQKPIFSPDQLDLLKRLQEQPDNQKYNLHFSRMHESSDDELKPVDEEPVNNLEQTEHSPEAANDTKLQESIIEDLGNSHLREDTPEPPPPVPQRKVLQAQKVAVKAAEVQVDNKKARPISALQLQPKVEEVKKIPVAQPAKQKKQINTNPFANRPKSVLQATSEQSQQAKIDNGEQSSTKVDAPNLMELMQPMNGAMENLLLRIQRMDENQRSQLEKVLDQIENQNSRIPAEEFKFQPSPKFDLKLPNKTLSTPTILDLNIDLRDQVQNMITLVIQSTWGSSTMVGLTEVQLFDMDNRLVQLHPSNLKLRNSQSIKPIDTIINNCYRTINAQNMWLASLPEQSRIEIIIQIQQDTLVGGLKIWNYNKSLIDSGKGVKDIVVKYVRDGKSFEVVAQIKKGPGNDMEEYATEVVLTDGFNFNSNATPKHQQQQPSQDFQYPSQNISENESQRVGSRKQRGPMVFNVFKEDEPLVRVPTAKGNKASLPDLPKEKKENESKLVEYSNAYETKPMESRRAGRDRVEPKQEKVDLEQLPRPEGKSRISLREPITKDYEQDELMKTLKHFEVNHPGRFQDLEKQPVQQKREVDTYDALDVFFRDQRKQPVVRQPVAQEPRQMVSQGEVKRARQTEINAQLIQQIITDNQQQLQKQQIKHNQSENLSQSFSIPTTPVGRTITLKILSTWGDRHYVGLNGIEFFDDKGQIIEINHPKRQVKADPSDINTLPEYDGDPRTPDKMVDGVYLTQSDLHVWLAPFQKGRINYIYLDLLEKRQISMIRIWNYNKSRIHSFRGVKELAIEIDNKQVFQGNISKAPGNLSFSEASNERLFECILFTDDQRAISHIAKTDWINSKYQDRSQQILSESILPRPNTGSRAFEYDDRPSTSVKVSQLQNEIKQARQLQIEMDRKQPKLTYKGAGVSCSYLRIDLHQSWQNFDATYIGLTGISVLDENTNQIQISPTQLVAQPKDMTAIQGHQGDKRVLTNLISETNITTKDQHMWMIPFSQGKQHYVQINFQTPQVLSGIKLWNYNKSPEDSFRGAKIVGFSNQNGCIINKYIIKKAPGIDSYDFGQFIPMPPPNIIPEQPDQQQTVPKGIPLDYETLQLPQGFDLKICLLETYGDIHYIGLNGIDIFDPQGNSLIRSKTNPPSIWASPSSVRDLQSMHNDPRVVQNLLKEPNETFDDQHMWLAPFVNRFFENPVEKFNDKLNTIFITFDRPLTIAAISFWNYSKHPERGVRELAIWLDERLIFKGYLRISQNQQTYKTGENMNQSVIAFSKALPLVEKFSGRYYNELDKQQRVNYQNESKGGQYVHQNYGSLDRPTTRVSEKS